MKRIYVMLIALLVWGYCFYVDGIQHEFAQQAAADGHGTVWALAVGLLWGIVIFPAALFINSIGTLLYVLFVVPRLSISWQRSWYDDWKRHMVKQLAKTDPHLQIPMTAYLEYCLDKEFNKGGLKHAIHHFDLKVDSLPSLYAKVREAKRTGDGTVYYYTGRTLNEKT